MAEAAGIEFLDATAAMFRTVKWSDSMTTVMSELARPVDQVQPAPAPVETLLEDVSPFGVQGLRRDTLRILKPECISRLAVTLALTGTPEQIRDEQFVNRVLERQAAWLDEYTVVHLIERSLWIAGHSDLVMTLTRNPSQIPDRPPADITNALTRSYALHPQGTIWYGVPVFGDKVNSQKLPIPLTAEQMRQEHARRIAAAQQHAIDYAWLYRAAARVLGFPGQCLAAARMLGRGIVLSVLAGIDTVRKARRDSLRRAAAINLAQMQMYRTGRTWVEVPEHETFLGRMAVDGLRVATIARKLFAVPAALAGLSAGSIALANVTPMLMVPMAVVSCDPFLFVELPEEAGKLRFLGHWYWQGSPYGRQKLHLHV